MPCSVIIPTRINTVDLYKTLDNLDRDPAVTKIILVAHGHEAEERLRRRNIPKAQILFADLSCGIHDMWNMAMDSIRGELNHVGFINDDVTLTEETVSIVCDLLTRKPEIGLVSASDKTAFTGEFAKGTAFAGFCFFMANDLVDEWRFDLRMRWHCGDDDVNFWVYRVKRRLVGITGLAHATNNRSFTLKTSPPPGLEIDIAKDREIFREKLRTFYSLFPPSHTV